MIYSPTVGLLLLCGIINLNYHSSLMFQIRGWVHGPFVPEPFTADSCADVINNIHIKRTSHICMQTCITKHGSRDADVYKRPKQYVGHVCAMPCGNLAELYLNYLSDVLFTFFSIN